jgi:hypothetical protein
MAININHTDNFNSGAYILNENRLSYSPFMNTTSVFLTQEDNCRLKEEILKLINESKEVIKICSFIITDKEIFDAILSKAKNTDTAIFVLTQLDQSKLTNSISLLDFLTEEEIKENPSQTHLNYIKKLFDNGVHVRASLSAHAKFIIADRVTGFITSANLTTPSLALNTESGVYLKENESKELDKLFDVIFQRGTSYRQFISSPKKNKILVVQAEAKIQKDILPDPLVSGLRFTYECETNNLYDQIIKIIDDASEYLYISSYSIVNLDKLNELTQALNNAFARGIKINIFCRGMNYRDDHLKGSEILHSNGSIIFADLFNHSKGIINENMGMIFTANIDGNHGLKNGFEVGCILDEKQRLEFLKIHQYLIETSYYIFQEKPSRIDLFATYANYELLKNIVPPSFPENLIISYQKGSYINQKELSELLLFYGKSGDAEYIIAGNSYYRCKTVEDTFHLIEKENRRFDMERYILKYENLKITSN